MKNFKIHHILLQKHYAYRMLSTPYSLGIATHPACVLLTKMPHLRGELLQEAYTLKQVSTNQDYLWDRLNPNICGINPKLYNPRIYDWVSDTIRALHQELVSFAAATCYQRAPNKKWPCVGKMGGEMMHQDYEIMSPEGTIAGNIIEWCTTLNGGDIPRQKVLTEIRDILHTLNPSEQHILFMKHWTWDLNFAKTDREVTEWLKWFELFIQDRGKEYVSPFKNRDLVEGSWTDNRT